MPVCLEMWEGSGGSWMMAEGLWVQKRTGPTRELTEAVAAGNKAKLEGVPDLRRKSAPSPAPTQEVVFNQ